MRARCPSSFCQNQPKGLYQTARIVLGVSIQSLLCNQNVLSRRAWSEVRRLCLQFIFSFRLVTTALSGPPMAYGPWNPSGQPFMYPEHVDEVSYGPSRVQLVEGSPKPLSLCRRVRWIRKVVSTTTRLEGTLRYIRTRLHLGPDSIRQGSRDINSLKVYLGPCERRRMYRRRSDTGRHLPTKKERYVVVYKR